MKKIELPAAVERYLKADADSDDALLAGCFTEDAEVRDEKRTIRGLEAITAWKQESKKKYRYQVEPLAASQAGDTLTLSARVTGSFPGSPVVLTYAFTLRGDRIAALAIG